MNIFRLKGNQRISVGYKTLHFPDGQPHLQLDHTPHATDYVITASLTSLEEVFNVTMAASILKASFGVVGLEIHYLLAARMDRAMSVRWPFTLKLVAGMLNQCGFDYVDILDPHSDVALDLIDCSERILPHKAFQACLQAAKPEVIVTPDIGAVNRVNTLVNRSPVRGLRMVQATKQREALSGQLQFGELAGPDPEGLKCLIVDDLCDGGATFINLAKVLRERGAKAVNLFVTHGLMSKGVELPGIDRTWTTTSYWPPLFTRLDDSKLVTFPAEEEFNPS